MLRESWCLADIEALPTGENDKFERKSGQLFDDKNFQTKLSKAVSAFANSGGGHIILGVMNDGAIDGVNKNVKRNISNQEWLEKLLPDLIEPNSLSFRVHIIEFDKTINKEVIVIDISDSIFAPFQVKTDKIYYCRSGSHSNPASHFYLEAIRNRPRLPDLTARLTNAKVVHTIQTDQYYFYQIALFISITNNGIITPAYWHIDLFNKQERLSSNGFIVRSNFPIPCLQNKFAVHQDIILPSQSIESIELIGIYFPPIPININRLENANRDLVENGVELSASVITNNHICEITELNNYHLIHALQSAKFFETDSDLMDDFRGYIGQGILLKQFSIRKVQTKINFFKKFSLEDDQPFTSLIFSGEIENRTDFLMNKVVLSVVFKDINDQVIYIDKTILDFIAPRSTHGFSGNVEMEKVLYAVNKEIYAFEAYAE